MGKTSLDPAEVAALAKQQAALAAFAADPHAAFKAGELALAAAYLAPAYALARQQFRKINFSSQVAREAFYARASKAAGDAVPRYETWRRKTRRRNTWAAFQDFIRLAVDRELKKPQPGQGVASGGKPPERTSSDGGDLPARNENRAMDLRTGATGMAPDVAGSWDTYTEDVPETELAAPEAAPPPPLPPARGVADIEVLDRFQRLYGERMRKLATAVIPYTDVPQERYVQTSHGRSPAAKQAAFAQELSEAVEMLQMYAASVATPAALDFEGVSPTPAHILQGSTHDVQVGGLVLGFIQEKLPGIPPIGPDLETAFGTFVEPATRRYFEKLQVWYSALSAAAREEAERGQIRMSARQHAIEAHRELIAVQREWAAAMEEPLRQQIEAERQANDAKIVQAARKALKRKAPTKKPAR